MTGPRVDTVPGRPAETAERDPLYRPIRDYAIIGDTHGAALVATDGSIDWCCCPTMDRPAIFCRLLDARKGGWCRIGPGGAFTATRSYLGNTNVLATTFVTDSGRMRVTDFMPMRARPTQGSAASRADDVAHGHRILRLVEGLEGEVELAVEFRPTFNFARSITRVSPREWGALAASDRDAMLFRCQHRNRIAHFHRPELHTLGGGSGASRQGAVASLVRDRFRGGVSGRVA